MNRLIANFYFSLFLFLAATASVVKADTLPDGSDPDAYEEGVYLLEAEEGNSWIQRIWVNSSNLGVYNKRPVNYQFRICTNPDAPYSGYGPQSLEAPDAFRLRGYGQEVDTVWSVGYAPHEVVGDALMYANGEPTEAGSGDMIWLTFLKGRTDTYLSPDVWFDTPEFVLQMQAYGYCRLSTTPYGPCQAEEAATLVRLVNKEFYNRGAGAAGTGPDDPRTARGGYPNVWGASSGSSPKPALESGYTRNTLGLDWACGAWTQDEPISGDAANTPPVADAGGPYLVAVGQTISLDGSGSYDDDEDILAYLWTQEPPYGSFDGASLESPDFTGVQAGMADLTLMVMDGALNDSDTALVVIYDPSGGFVTGGGWIYSEPGSYIPDLDLEGKASFGFVSKYKKGANVPTGNTEFQFKTAGFNFHSTDYDWLVVNQGGDNAQFKGSGTINGTGNYKFMLWAGDGAPDTFRIKIWEQIEDVEWIEYDNGFNQSLGGGSIVIHTNKK